jgi:hypothetical protein
MDSSPASSAAERLCCHRTAAFSLRFVADEETRRRSLMSSSSVERARGREHKAPRLQLLRLVIRRSPGAGTSHQLLVVISVRSPSAFERRACWQALRLSDLATRNQPRSNPLHPLPLPLPDDDSCRRATEAPRQGHVRTTAWCRTFNSQGNRINIVYGCDGGGCCCCCCSS